MTDRLSKRIMVIDLETGGLPDSAPITQFFGTVIDWFDMTKVLEELEVKFQFNLDDCSPDALEINSYKKELWADEAVTKEEGTATIEAFLKRHATEPMISKAGNIYRVCRLAGHNIVRFDEPKFQLLWRDEDKEAAQKKAGTWNGVPVLKYFPSLVPIPIDTMLEISNHSANGDIRKRPKNFKLITCCQYYGLWPMDENDPKQWAAIPEWLRERLGPSARTHDARTDAYMTAALLDRITAGWATRRR